MPVNDDGANSFVPPSPEEIRWVIFVRGGGLYSYPSNTDDGGGAVDTSGGVVIPGGGVTDPVRDQFFYEWRATPDENRMGPSDPRVTDPGVPEGGEVAGFSGGASGASYATFPATDSSRSGVMGPSGSTLSKTSTVTSGVLTESFSGTDSSGRDGEGVFGGAGIFPL